MTRIVTSTYRYKRPAKTSEGRCHHRHVVWTGISNRLTSEKA
jgi:hypothetical protein